MANQPNTPKFNMSKLRRLSNGEYMDVNGNIITNKGELTQNAFNYLKGRYSKAYADRVGWNTRNKNIYQNGSWRLDNGLGLKNSSWDEAISKKVINEAIKNKKAKYDSKKKLMFLDENTGKYTYFNLADKEATWGKSKSNEAKSKNKKKRSKKTEETSKKDDSDFNVDDYYFVEHPDDINLYSSGYDWGQRLEIINNLFNPFRNNFNPDNVGEGYSVEKFVNSPLAKLLAIPTKGTMWTFLSALNCLLPAGLWLIGYDKQGGQLIPRYLKGSNMFRPRYIRKGENGLTATYTKTKDNDYYLKHNLNKRGKYNNWSWETARNNALTDPKYAKLRQELEAYGKLVINNNWSLKDASTDEIQRLMVGYADNGNYQFDKNIFNTKSNFVDNRWGSQTQSAWEHLNNAVNTGEENNPSPITITNQKERDEAIPNYSAWDYSKGVDNLGFNDYAGLVNFVKENANHGFAKDLIHRFGAVDTWKQADIENALGVRGRYGKGFLGSGDYADMLRSMATWAGENDAKYNYRANPNTLVNRSLTRLILRELGFNPYSFTGAERRALRMHLNNNTGYDPLQRIKQGIGNILLNRNANTLTQNETDFLQKLYPLYFTPARDASEVGLTRPKPVSKPVMEETANYVSLLLNSPQTKKAKKGMKLPSRNIVLRFKLRYHF